MSYWSTTWAVVSGIGVYNAATHMGKLAVYMVQEWRWRRSRRNEPGIDMGVLYGESAPSYYAGADVPSRKEGEA